MKFNKKIFYDILIGAAGSMVWSIILWCIAWCISAISSKGDGLPTFMDVLTMNIPLWILLVIIGVIIFVFIFWKRVKRYPFLEFTSMKIGGFEWKWIWDYDKARKKYIISALDVYCPQCNKVLTSHLYAKADRSYSCINQHFYSDGNINLSQIEDNIIAEARERYPNYRNEIAKDYVFSV